jgi:hypothetical protein
MENVVIASTDWESPKNQKFRIIFKYAKWQHNAFFIGKNRDNGRFIPAAQNGCFLCIIR